MIYTGGDIFQFQFPSNGKAYPKSFLEKGLIGGLSLFQFPSNGKADPKFEETTPRNERNHKFQFPSNGKAYPKDFMRGTDDNNYLLVFQFPSNGKADPKKKVVKIGLTTFSFNSLQTGKRIQSHHTHVIETGNIVFQFPSNGKADPKKLQAGSKARWNMDEFQFPSNGKAYPCYDMKYQVTFSTYTPFIGE